MRGIGRDRDDLRHPHPVGLKQGENMEYQHVLLEIDDPVATITLNRPDKLNALTLRTTDELRHALIEAEPIRLAPAPRPCSAQPGQGAASSNALTRKTAICARVTGSSGQ